MALHCGGSDGCEYGPFTPTGNQQTVAFWLRTTQTTTNVSPLTYWTFQSKDGVGFLLNNTAGKILLYGKNGSTEAIKTPGATTVNDGNWHHVCGLFDKRSGFANKLYIDGLLDASVNNNGGSLFGNNPIRFGESNDTFWAHYVGDIAEIAIWNNWLSDDEIASIGKFKVSPQLIRRNDAAFHVPGVGMLRNVWTPGPPTVGAITTLGAPTIAAHPRILGGVMH